MKGVVVAILAVAVVLMAVRLLVPSREPLSPAPASMPTPPDPPLSDRPLPPDGPVLATIVPRRLSDVEPQPAPVVVTVRVVDARDGAPIHRAPAFRIADPLKPVDRGEPTAVTDAQGLAVLAGPGWYAFESRGFASRCVRVNADVDEKPSEVRLSPSGRAAIRLVTPAGVALPGIEVRAFTQYPLVEDGDAAAAAPAADLGRKCAAVTDGDGVARFEGLPAGEASFTIRTTEYLRARRDPGWLSVAEDEHPPVEVVLRPLFIGGLVMEGVPLGLYVAAESTLPADWEAHYPFMGDKAVECFPGQVGKTEERLEKLIDPAVHGPGAVVRFLSATPASPRAEALDAVATVRLLWKQKGVATTEVRLFRPSQWTPGDCARVSVSRDGFGPLTEVRVRFQTALGADSAAPCPAVLDRPAGSITVPVDGPPGPVVVFAPQGAYQLKPDLMTWSTADSASFEPQSVTVGKDPVDVSVRLNHPVALVALDVRDEFGRQVSRFSLQTRSSVSTGHFPGTITRAIDDDEWEFAITGVQWAGYADIPMHREPVQRGQLTKLTYNLRRKE